MRKLATFLTSILNRLLSYLPTKLPVGVTEFHIWSDAIIALSGKYADEDSLRFALATMIMHADAKHGALPKAYFVSRLRKVAANQVAGQIFQNIKEKQAEAAAKKQAEDTASQAKASSDGQKEESSH